MNASPKLLIVALIALLAAGTSSHAQSTDTGFKLKHRSSFSVSVTRNPFWPIGWVKGADVTPGTGVAQEQQDADIRPESFNVSSISISTVPEAIINGKIYAEGDVINAIYAGQKVKLVLLAVNDGSVVIQYGARKITVQVKHPELPQHQNATATEAMPAHNNDTIYLR